MQRDKLTFPELASPYHQLHLLPSGHSSSNPWHDSSTSPRPLHSINDSWCQLNPSCQVRELPSSERARHKRAARPRPYSRLRCQSLDPKKHKDFQVTFGETGSVLAEVAAGLFNYVVVEEGMDFQRGDTGGRKSPMHMCIDQMMNITGPDGKPRFVGSVVFSMSSK